MYVIEIASNEQTSSAANIAKLKMSAIVERITAFRKEIGTELQSAINAYLITRSPQSASEKRILAEQITGLLTELGFAIERDGQPCSLYSYSSGRDRDGRFRIQPRSSKSALVHSKDLNGLLPLAIMDIGTVHSMFGIDEQTNRSDSSTWQQHAKKTTPKDRSP